MSSVTLDVRAPARHSDSADPDQMILTRAVATRYGISVRTLDRWLVKPIAFPRPTMVTRDIIGTGSEPLLASRRSDRLGTHADGPQRGGRVTSHGLQKSEGPRPLRRWDP